MHIAYLKLNHSITSAEYGKLYNVSKSTTNRDIKELVDLKILAIECDGKNTVFQLIM